MRFSWIEPSVDQMGEFQGLRGVWLPVWRTQCRNGTRSTNWTTSTMANDGFAVDLRKSGGPS